MGWDRDQLKGANMVQCCCQAPTWPLVIAGCGQRSAVHSHSAYASEGHHGSFRLAAHVQFEAGLGRRLQQHARRQNINDVIYLCPDWLPPAAKPGAGRLAGVAVACRVEQHYDSAILLLPPGLLHNHLTRGTHLHSN